MTANACDAERPCPSKNCWTFHAEVCLFFMSTPFLCPLVGSKGECLAFFRWRFLLHFQVFEGQLLDSRSTSVSTLVQTDIAACPSVPLPVQPSTSPLDTRALWNGPAGARSRVLLLCSRIHVASELVLVQHRPHKSMTLCQRVRTTNKGCTDELPGPASSSAAHGFKMDQTSGKDPLLSPPGTERRGGEGRIRTRSTRVRIFD